MLCAVQYSSLIIELIELDGLMDSLKGLGWNVYFVELRGAKEANVQTASCINSCDFMINFHLFTGLYGL